MSEYANGSAMLLSFPELFYVKAGLRDVAFLLLGTGEQVEWTVCPVLHVNPLIPMDILTACVSGLGFLSFPTDHCMDVNSVNPMDIFTPCVCVSW